MRIKLGEHFRLSQTTQRTAESAAHAQRRAEKKAAVAAQIHTAIESLKEDIQHRRSQTGIASAPGESRIGPQTIWMNYDLTVSREDLQAIVVAQSQAVHDIAKAENAALNFEVVADEGDIGIALSMDLSRPYTPPLAPKKRGLFW